MAEILCIRTTNQPEATMNLTSQPATTTLPRRRFLAQSAATLTALVAEPSFSRAKGTDSQRSIGVGFIGCGSRSESHFYMVQKLRDEMKMPVELVACCDIYRPRLERRQRDFQIKRTYSDYHKLLDDPAVDLVCISTPDHQHASQALDAVKAGKHVYCEKPISHWSQFEATKRLADAVAASKTAFVCGTQAMSDPAWRKMKELIREGVIGQPIQAEIGFFRTGDWGERGMPVDDPGAKPGADLDWEAFLAPDRPKVPFSVDRLFRWRLFADYAGGPLTDLYPHCLAQVVDMLDLGFPEQVAAIGSVSRYPYELRDVPDTFHAIAQYPKGLTISLAGTQGNDFQTTPHRGAGQRSPVVRGWDGTLYMDDSNREIVCRSTEGSSRSKSIEKFPIDGNENNLMLWKNLIDCALEGRQDTWSPMDLAFRTQTMLQMAMTAHLKGRTVHFDINSREMVV
jgi:predicted dehydrogenase